MIIVQQHEAAELATAHLTKSDPILAGIIGKVGPYQMARLAPSFETLARSITFQQLSGKAARTIFERLRKAVGRRFTAAAFLRLSEHELRACGLSRQKIAYLTDLAEHVASRRINFRNLGALNDQQVIECLSQVKGVGVWTAQMFLMFALERPNVMPSADLGIRNAIQKAYALAEVPTPAEIEKYAEKWHPHCTVASWYLWRSLEGAAVL